MATFPKLKTNAVAQYPAGKGLLFRNQTVRFVDGREQRYRDSAGPLHRWTIHMEQLDESEMAGLQQFFQDNQGRQGSFAFTDPWDGTQYANCGLEGDDLELTSLGEMRGTTSLSVVENRG